MGNPWTLFISVSGGSFPREDGFDFLSSYERSDRQPCPKDWIKNGPRSNDVDLLNEMILLLLSDMGCL